jgi:4-hydroxybenzoate polyprenyltransferase
MLQERELHLFKEWSMLFRSHTAPATIAVVMIGFILGGGKLFSLYALLLIVFSIFLHYFIFGNNSLMHACIVPRVGELPYDAQDKMKKHHPLMTEKIKLSTAHKVIYTGIFLISIVAIIISFYGTGNTSLSLAFFLIFGVTGFAYNCGLSKVTVWKFLPISTCFASLCAYSFFLMSGRINILFILVLIYIFLAEVFQTAIEGDQKDIETNVEINLLRLLGTKISENKIFMSFSSKIISWFIKLANLAIGIYIFIYIDFDYEMLIFVVLLTLLAIYFAFKIINDKEWGREKKQRYYSFEEMSTIFLLITVLAPYIGLLEVVTIILFGTLYFIVFNKINWGTFFTIKT